MSARATYYRTSGRMRTWVNVMARLLLKRCSSRIPVPPRTGWWKS